MKLWEGSQKAGEEKRNALLRMEKGEENYCINR
jgi:hypothetical protein